MSITIFSQGRNTSRWADALRERRPGLEVRTYPETGSPDEVEFALAWNHPQGVFKAFPNLKCIASTGAGVDHILRDPELPEGVKITRIVDENLTHDMAAFVTALVLNQVRGLHSYKEAQRQHTWKQHSYLRTKDVVIGMMGMGELGSYAAQQLSKLGFKVHGWSRSPKLMEGVGAFAGPEEFDSFLSSSHILICLLPLTKQTANILHKDTFSKLPKGAYVINVARGEHLVDQDLIDMIDQGHLSGASLDVFREEPLPADHAFWSHPAIHVTPHIASVTNPESAVSQILENYDRMRHGEALINVVSKTKGY
ncbi:glyoxylate/hydroxypyruvate reductase A [Pontibacter sp. JH31]|uniref:Glyoxylate/hydroxypyruvate reductase A n=1 Tax=Pontibacter aquaedesilientis TaxID=2766980 RepID=A0ABR7XBQ7_9BACT|nr:glyoxylate/hydroxypyruvate reductase A [Pontibacter aquaedesilientis]MBD1395722.1 glyoxylate/hydroxypyruvate reductase A [Pontibacter aquaedesilientis]